MHYSDNRNVIGAVRAAAGAYPERRITMYDGRCRPVSARSYRDLLDAAQAMAARIGAQGVEPGDRVLVCLPNSWDWLDAWLGAVWMGALPVAASPGLAMGAAAWSEEKTFGIAQRLGARMVICGEGLYRRAAAAPEECRVVTPAVLAGTGAETAEPWDAAPGDVAYLQLTSGSTGAPKPAQVTHAGMMHNVWAMFDAATRRRRGEAPRSGTTWLPLYHDFGLVMTIGGILNGVEVAVYPPNAFLGRPHEWLRQLGEMDAPMCGMPNFGLHHAVNRITPQRMAEMDLSGWHTCFIGAEMTRAETLSAFMGKFADVGCPAEMLAPSYGMAEATLGVTLDQKAVGLRIGISEPDEKGDRVEVVCCGAPLKETELRIMGAEGEMPEGHVGEVWLKAGGVVSGYFEAPEQTAEAFDGGWFRTGDLGFMRNGEIYLTGRAREVLIVDGTSYMPDELEQLAEGEGSGGMERAAAFTVASDARGDQPVLVVEVDRRSDPAELDEMAGRIARRMARELGMTLREVVFVPRGAIPRTTSGKLQRGALREAWLGGSLTPLRTGGGTGDA